MSIYSLQNNKNMSDNEIKTYFQTHKPSVTDTEAFDAELQKKMAALAELKQMHTKALHRYRLLALVTMIVGLLVGGALGVLLWLHPIHKPEIALPLLTQLCAFVTEWRTLFMLLFVFVVIVLSEKVAKITN